MERPTLRIANLDTHEPIIRWGTATLSPDGQIQLHVLGVHEAIRVCLSQAVLLGRADKENGIEVNVDLSPFGAAGLGVSRHHATLELVRKTVMLMDLGSTNGTFLNDQRVLPQPRRVVRDNDEIRLGKMIIHVYF